MTLRLEATGNYTDRDLNEYVLFTLGIGSCSQENPFVAEDGDAELTYAEIQ